MQRLDAIVVGSGIMGSAAARALGRRGLATVLLEQYEVGHDRASSRGPTRVFRLAYPEPDYVRLAVRALDSWRELEDEAGENLLVTVGGLYAGGWADEAATGLAACGVPHDWLDVMEAAERFPAMSFDGLERVLWQGDGGVCLAERAVRAQARLAQAAGVELREHDPVERLVQGDDGVRVETPAGSFAARVAILTAGPWASRVSSQVGLRLPICPSFGQVSYFPPRPKAPPAVPTFIEAGQSASGPRSGYWVPPVAGATEVRVGDGLPGREVDPSAGPFAVDVERAARDAGFVRRRLPAFDPVAARSETCVYAMAPDNDFVLARLGNLVIGAGFGGHGFKFGPLIGEILADLATGGAPDLPQGRFNLDRLALRATEGSRG